MKKELLSLGSKLLMAVGLFWAGATAMAQTTVEKSTFSSVNGTLDGIVSYNSDKGGGTSGPIIRDNAIRLYQKNGSNSYGGYITLSVAEGYQITSATIGSSMKTTIAYTLDDETALSASSALSAGAKYTKSDLAASSISFYCLGTDKYTRLYVNYLSVTYKSLDPTAVSAPVISYDMATATVSMTAEEGCSIYYTINGDDPTIASTLYTAPFTVASSCTVKAIASDASGKTSSVASEDVTVATVYNDIASFIAAAPEEAQALKLVDAVVLGVISSATSNGSLVVKDATGAIVIYGMGLPSASYGQKINGIVSGTFETFGSMPELTSPVFEEGVTVTDGGVLPTPIEVSDLSTLSADNMLQQVTLKGVTFQATGLASYVVTVKDAADNSYIVGNRLNSSISSFDITKNADVTGLVYQTNQTTVAVCPQREENIVYEEIIDTRVDPTFEFSATTANAVLGETFTAPTLTNGSDNAASYSSSNTTVATVDATTGEITLKKAGKTTINAMVLGSDTYKPATASYELTVTIAPAATVISLANGDVVFDTANGSFDGMSGGSYATTIASADFNSVAGKPYTFSYVSAIKQSSYVQLQAKNGILTFPEIEGFTYGCKVSVSSSSTTKSNSMTLVSYEDEATAAGTVSANAYTSPAAFELSAGGKYVQVSNITITPLLPYTATVSAAKYATIYLDFNAEVPAGMTAYAVSNISATTLTLSAIEAGQVLEKNHGYILCAEAGEYTFTPSGADVTYTGDNWLEGCLVETAKADLPASIYTLATGSIAEPNAGIGFYHYTNEKLAAHKAYLDATLIPEGASEISALRFDFEPGNITSIETITNDAAKAEAIYNINGQRVESMNHSGLYIVGGKKVMVK